MVVGSRLAVLRSRDLLALEIELVDLRVEQNAGAVPRLVPDGANPLILFHLPPQHVAELAYLAGDPVSQAGSRLANPSRVAFRVNQPIPFTLESLLDWEQPALTLKTPAIGGSADANSTALELPFRMILALDAELGWDGRSDVLEVAAGDGGAWVGLWHKRLARGSGSRRAWVVAARDPDAADPFARMSVSASNRRDIATLSRAKSIADGPDLAVGEIMLTSLGASIDLAGSWPDSTLPVVGWKHNTGTGRDQRVLVETQGFLYPFGHRANLTTISERTFTDDGKAILKTRSFITVAQREREFETRDMPFRRVRVETAATPELSNTIDTGGWPEVGGSRFQFQLSGHDWSGNWVDFSLPLGFVVNDVSVLDTADGSATGLRTDLGRRTIAIAAAVDAQDLTATLAVDALKFSAERNLVGGTGALTFRPLLVSAEVVLPAVNQLFGGESPVELAYSERFLKHGYDVARDRNPSQMFANFVGNGLPVQAAAQQAGGMIAPSLNFVGISRSLGPVSGTGATAVEAVDQIAKGSFDPVSFLGKETRLFGTIRLTELFEAAGIGGASASGEEEIEVKPLLERINGLPPAQRDAELRNAMEVTNIRKLVKAPTMSTRDVVNADSLQTGLEVTYLWKPKLKQLSSGPLRIFDGTETPVLGSLPPPAQPSLLWMVTRLMANAGEEPTYVVEGNLTSFRLCLLDVIEIDFSRLIFRTERGKGTDLRPEVKDVQLTGALSFVKDISAILKSMGADIPIDLEVQPTSITARYALGFPTVSVGIFAIENLRLSVGLKLPFIPEAGPVRVRFALAERSAPFLVTYSIFAGGGFFALALDTAGGFDVEASIEFGGKLAIDLVVAKGGVYAMAGIYFGVVAAEVKISAFLRAGGYVNILGIATISIEFYVALTYLPLREVLEAEAKVTACIEILFFSECISFGVKVTVPDTEERTAERIAVPEFAFADFDEFVADAAIVSEPVTNRVDGFESIVGFLQWQDYCAAFA